MLFRVYVSRERNRGGSLEAIRRLKGGYTDRAINPAINYKLSDRRIQVLVVLI